eukprot:11510-Chlamydomonas_euryale.AAC.1
MGAVAPPEAVWMSCCIRVACRVDELLRPDVLLMSCSRICSLTKFPLLPFPMAGVDPKSVVCEFFRHGQCTKGFKCKYSHDLNVEKKGPKIDLFTDQRDVDKVDEEGMEDWDQETLERVVKVGVECVWGGGGGHEGMRPGMLILLPSPTSTSITSKRCSPVLNPLSTVTVTIYKDILAVDSRSPPPPSPQHPHSSSILIYPHSSSSHQLPPSPS